MSIDLVHLNGFKVGGIYWRLLLECKNYPFPILCIRSISGSETRIPEHWCGLKIDAEDMAQ